MSNKIRKKVITKVVKKLELDESVQHLEKRISAFTTAVEAKQSEIIAKHNELAKGFNDIAARQQEIANFAATKIGELLGQLQMLAAQQEVIVQQYGRSINHLDVSQLAYAEVLKEVFGQLAQEDVLIARLAGTVTSTEFSEADIAEVKARSSELYTEVVTAAFASVNKKRAEEEAAYAEKKAAEQAAKEAAEKAAQDKTEAQTAEQALLDAAQADRAVQTVGATGGQGATIPDGANVFGG
jgi:hypothetical protein